MTSAMRGFGCSSATGSERPCMDTTSKMATLRCQDRISAGCRRRIENRRQTWRGLDSHGMVEMRELPRGTTLARLLGGAECVEVAGRVGLHVAVVWGLGPLSLGGAVDVVRPVDGIREVLDAAVPYENLDIVV